VGRRPVRILSIYGPTVPDRKATEIRHPNRVYGCTRTFRNAPGISPRFPRGQGFAACQTCGRSRRCQGATTSSRLDLFRPNDCELRSLSRKGSCPGGSAKVFTSSCSGHRFPAWGSSRDRALCGRSELLRSQLEPLPSERTGTPPIQATQEFPRCRRARQASKPVDCGVK